MSEQVRIRVWRAWDDEWAAECDEHAEIHWGHRWSNAMEAAWGHIAMQHPRRPLRLVIPDPIPGQIDRWDTTRWLLTNGSDS